VPDSSFVHTLSCTEAASADALQSVRHAAAGAMDAGAERIIIELDAAPVLDARVIAALVSVLRDARERGVAMTLRASRASILDTLRITGLDKIFTIEAAEHPAPVAERKRGRPTKAAAVLRALRPRTAQ